MNPNEKPLTNGSWLAHKKLIENQIQRIEDSLTVMREEIVRLRIGQERLNVKAGMWGALAGVVVAAVVALITRN